MRLFRLQKLGYKLDVVYSKQLIVEWPGMRIRDLISHSIGRNSLYVSQDSSFSYFLKRLRIRRDFYSACLLMKVFVRQILFHLYFKKIGYLVKDEFFLKKIFRNSVVVPHDIYNINEDSEILEFGVPDELSFWGSGGYEPNQLAFKRIEFFDEYNLPFVFSVWGNNYPNQNHRISRGWLECLNDLRSPNNWALFPIEIGSGIKNKTLESISLGIPSIGLNEAYQGIIGFESYKGIFTELDDLVMFLEEKKSQEDWIEIYLSFRSCREKCLDFYRNQNYLQSYKDAYRDIF